MKTNNLRKFPTVPQPFGEEALFEEIQAIHNVMKQSNIYLELIAQNTSPNVNKSCEIEENGGLWFFKYKDLFQKLKNYMDDLINCFDDPRDKIQNIGVIKDLIYELKNKLNKESYKYERRICVVLYDSLLKNKAERIDINHLDILNQCFEILFKGNCKQDDFRLVDKKLREADLNWIIGDDCEKTIFGDNNQC